MARNDSEQLKNAPQPERGERASIETSSREFQDLTDDDRVQMLREEFLQQALPTTPKIKGFHTCWLSQTNQYDTIQRRMRLGYVPVKPEEIGNMGFDVAVQKGGDYAGLIVVNEMVLFKIPQSLYERFMKVMHEDLPNEQDDKLRANLELIKSGQLSKGHSIVREIGDGTDEVLRNSAEGRKSGPPVW